MKHLLSVYGTLKKGFHNSYILGDSKLLGEQEMPGFKMFSMGGFPAINIADEDSKIKVEVYEVTEPEVLKRVYMLENYTGKRDHPDNWYDTVEVPTKWGNAEMFYFKEPIDRPEVTSGVWGK